MDGRTRRTGVKKYTLALPFWPSYTRAWQPGICLLSGRELTVAEKKQNSENKNKKQHVSFFLEHERIWRVYTKYIKIHDLSVLRGFWGMPGTWYTKRYAQHYVNVVLYIYRALAVRRASGGLKRHDAR